jgi:hypothetical protein
LRASETIRADEQVPLAVKTGKIELRRSCRLTRGARLRVWTSLEARFAMVRASETIRADEQVPFVVNDREIKFLRRHRPAMGAGGAPGGTRRRPPECPAILAR